MLNFTNMINTSLSQVLSDRQVTDRSAQLMAGAAALAAFPRLTELAVEWVGHGDGMPCWALPPSLRSLRVTVRVPPAPLSTSRRIRRPADLFLHLTSDTTCWHAAWISIRWMQRGWVEDSLLLRGALRSADPCALSLNITCLFVGTLHHGRDAVPMPSYKTAVQYAHRTVTGAARTRSISRRHLTARSCSG